MPSWTERVISTSMNPRTIHGAARVFLSLLARGRFVDASPVAGRGVAAVSEPTRRIIGITRSGGIHLAMLVAAIAGLAAIGLADEERAAERGAKGPGPRFRAADHRMVEAVRWSPNRPAEHATDFFLFSRGTSNANLVTTDEGDVVINTGSPFEAARHRERLEALLGRRLDVRKIVLSQFHSDHVGGWSSFAAPSTDTIAQRELPRLREEWRGLRPYYMPRGYSFLSAMMPDPKHLESYFEDRDPEISTPVDEFHAFELGGRRFELYATPNGETLDGLSVWLPGDRVLFIGNFAGALYGAMPNFYTIRGDRQRSVPGFLKDLRRLIGLDAEILVTGHGEPIRGSAKIRADLTRLYDAVKYIHDETIEGMNAREDVHTLMARIELPERLELAAGRSPTRWVVRSVWEEYSGWFMGESTTELYEVPPRAIWPDLVELAGGTSRLVERARRYVEGGMPLAALHLIDIALVDDPGDHATRALQIEALTALIDRSAGLNFDELGWLENQIELARKATKSKEQDQD